jgi:electron transport complex protein RnfA
MGDLIVLAISCILINNILLAQYLGNCPFLGTSKKMETAVGMAMAVVFVLVLAGVITWITNTYFPVCRSRHLFTSDYDQLCGHGRLSD